MKKQIKLFLAVLIVSSIVYSQTQERIPWPSLMDSPWPVGRGDVQGTGRSEYVGPENPQIILEQTYPLGIKHGPVIGFNDNIVFGTVAGNFGNEENYFYSADSIGNELWRFSTFWWVPNDCAPAVAADGTIYFGTQGPNPSYFFSLNADGTMKWVFETQGAINLPNIVLDKKGNVYFASSDSIFAFSPNGTKIFSLGIPGITAKGISFSPSGDTLYVSSVYYDEPDYIYHLFSVSTSGEIHWKKQFERIGPSTVLVDNSGRTYLAAASLNDQYYVQSFYCLNSDGSINWEVNSKNGAIPDIWDSGGPTIDSEGNITFNGFVKKGDEYKNGLASIDYNGNLWWTYAFELEDWFEEQSVEINHGLVCDAEGTIYAGANRGYYLYAITKEGQLKWKLRLKDYYVSASPVIGKKGRIYLGRHHGAWENDLEKNLLIIGDIPNSVEDEETPTEFALYQNYPNPFNPSTTIKFTVPNVGTTHELSLRVYDILGREIATLVNEIKPVGSYEIEFDASELPSGIFFYRLQSGDFTQTKKMMVLK